MKAPEQGAVAPQSRRVGSVSRALSIIELLIAHENHEMGVSDIARQLGVGKSTAHQLLATMVIHGFVEQNEASGRYRLGVRLMEAGAVATAHFGLGPTVTPHLDELVRAVGETSSIGVLAQDEIVLLHRVEAASVLRVDLKVGTRLPLHTSAIGHVLMSTNPDPVNERILDGLGLSSAERANTERAVEAVKASGCAIVRDTPIAGINAIAVPICNAQRRAIAGLVVAGPSSRFNPDDYREIVLEKAAVISEKVRMHHLG